jgi:hypothetical protein
LLLLLMLPAGVMDATISLQVSVRAFGQSAAQQMSMLSSMTQAGPSGCTSALDLLNKSKTSHNAKKVRHPVHSASDESTTKLSLPVLLSG